MSLDTDARRLFIRDRLAFLFSDENLISDRHMRLFLRRGGVPVSELMQWSTFSSIEPPVTHDEIIVASAKVSNLEFRESKFQGGSFEIFRTKPFNEWIYGKALRTAVVVGASKIVNGALVPASLEDVRAVFCGVGQVQQKESRYVVLFNEKREVDIMPDIETHYNVGPLAIYTIKPVIERKPFVLRYKPPRVVV